MDYRTKGVMVAAFLFALTIPVTMVAADEQADRAAYQRNIDKQVQDLKLKVNEVKEDYREEGVRVDQKIREYEDKMAEIQREADAKLKNKDYNSANWKRDNDDIGGRLGGIREDFNEWRLERSINGYNEKIADLKIKADAEQNTEKKIELTERIQKLDAKYNAAKAKLNDLRATNGDNWDRIEQELDMSLKEIDRDYDEAKAAHKAATRNN